MGKKTFKNVKAIIARIRCRVLCCISNSNIND